MNKNKVMELLFGVSNPSGSKGRMTLETMDKIMEKMPGVWEKYCNDTRDNHNYCRDTISMAVISILSLSNFIAYLKDHKEEWVECPNRKEWPRVMKDKTGEYTKSAYFCENECKNNICNGTGKIINPEYVEVLKEMEVEG